VGRARQVTGPYLDNMGVDMIEGGGKLFAGSRGRHVGPGHFGLLDLGQGVQKFSLHYEADLDRGGISVLDIRPLLWSDGWPVAGDNLVAGTYTFESARTGTVLELAVQGFPVGGFRQRRGGPPGSGIVGGAPGGPPPGAPPPFRSATGTAPGPGHRRPGFHPGRGELARDDGRASGAGQCSRPSKNGPSHPRPMPAAHPARRTFASASRAPSARSPRRRRASSRRRRSAARPEQLWRIDQLTDGTYRISPKSVPGQRRFTGALRGRQQHADAREVRPGERSPTLVAEDAVMNRRLPA
jgi:arabinan endo-1,5-alpha-L-arabinosidase